LEVARAVMSTEIVPLGFADLDVQPGSHIAFTYESEEKRQDSLFGFMASGLRNHEKCIAAVAEYPDNLWAEGLRAYGIERSAVPEGQIEILTAGQMRLDAVPDAVCSVADLLARRITSSLAEGWRSARICTSFHHLYQYGYAVAELLTADSRMNDIIRNMPVTLLCTFAANRLHPSLLDASLSCHAFITDGNSISPNDRYQDPIELSGRLPEIMYELNASGALVKPFACLDFYGDTPVIRTGDELDICTTPLLQDLAEWVISMNHKELVIDLSGTTYLDASAIRTLAGIALAMESRDGRLSICDPLDPPRKIFQIVGFQERIVVRYRLEEAVESARVPDWYHADG